MSSDQVTIEAFEPGDGRPLWDPETSEGSASGCQSCGGHVADGFGAVFGDEQNRLWACPDCASMTAIRRGAAADPEFDRRVSARGGSYR